MNGETQITVRCGGDSVFVEITKTISDGSVLLNEIDALLRNLPVHVIADMAAQYKAVEEYEVSLNADGEVRLERPGTSQTQKEQAELRKKFPPKEPPRE